MEKEYWRIPTRFSQFYAKILGFTPTTPSLPPFGRDCEQVLGTIHSVVRRNLNPTIENFLSGTPLNIQSIAFDIESQKVIGDIGLRSIQEKIIAVNDLEQAKYRAHKKGVSIETLIIDIADQFNFTPIYAKHFNSLMDSK